jgi:hypothetical protein
MSHPVIRSIICEICKRARQTQSWFDVCPAGARNLPKMRCDACNKTRFKLQADSSICHGCTGKLLKEKILCSCGRSDYAFKEHPTCCRKCHDTERIRDWKKTWSARVKCPSCGKEKRPFRKADLICAVCYRKEMTANTQCVFPRCDKPVDIRKSQLCRLHHDDQEASRLLKEYLESYATPFPQNRHYMSVLASTIDWEAVANNLLKIRGGHFHRFRAFGEFLKTYELPEALTWDAIVPTKILRNTSLIVHPDCIHYRLLTLDQIVDVLCNKRPEVTWVNGVKS